MNASRPLSPSDTLTSGVLAVFAEVTRYPPEILDPAASLEEDLGIDSVKLGEVFSVLRERYALPETLAVSQEHLKTIGSVAEALSAYLRDTPAPVVPSAEVPRDVAAPQAPEAAPSNVPLSPDEPGDILEGVLAVFAEVTRYPPEILDPAASLEEDLGIDSVKLGEVFSVLRERYALPETLAVSQEHLKTIGSVAEALSAYVHDEAVPARVVPAVAAPMPARASAIDVHGDGAHTAPPVPTPSIGPSFAALQPEAKPFKGKVVFISGSGHGLGKDMAEYLAELGASVVVNSFHSRQRGIATTEAIKAKGGDATHVWGSVANPVHVQAIFDEIEATYGGLDFFISNASNGMLARLEDITVEHWEKAFRTNIVGLHQGALRAVEMMKKRGGGKIITLSSPAAHGYVDYFGCMGAVKAAVESLTRSMAIEFAPYNIQVNCVSPGPVYGELMHKWPESERLIPQWERNTPYERLCEARDVSHFVAYLLSEPVKLFTGSVLVLDGGISSQGW